MTHRTPKKLSLERGAFFDPENAVESVDSYKSDRILKSLVSHNKEKGLRVFVAGGAREGNSKIYVEEAYALGQKIGELDFRLDFGFSNKGIMGAVARGVIEAWTRKGIADGYPIGAVTTDHYYSLYQKDDTIMQFSNVIVAKTLEERKRMLLDADFVIFAPGGLGTLDELVYDCVAMQDGMLPMKPFVIFNIEGYFYHLMEYLKEIAQRRFADRMPFIVVDSTEEAGIVFEVLKSRYASASSVADAYAQVRQIIYELPYIIDQVRKHPTKDVPTIVERINAIMTLGNPKAQATLTAAVEESYLVKESERMFTRLIRAGKDVAVAGNKLEQLMKRKKQTTLQKRSKKK